MASKGLGQGYEICTAEQKDLLVSELVDTLLTGKRLLLLVGLGRGRGGGGGVTYFELS